LFQFPLGTVMLVLNIPFFIWALFKVGKELLIKSVIGTVLLATFIDLLDYVPQLTNDRFLSCIYGGVCIGIGMALVLKSGSSTGGTDLITYIARAYKQLSLTSADEMYTQLAAGGAFIGRVAAVLFGYYNDDKHLEEQKDASVETTMAAINDKAKKTQHRKKDMSGIVVKGVDNLMIRVSKCCNPVPGDEIIGFITKGRGISVHRADCANVLAMPEEERSRFIEVEWDQTKLDKSYSADISIIADDRKGLLSDISRVCDDMDVNITGVNARSDKDRVVTITMTLSISNTAQMEKILRSLRSVQGVTDVYRAAV